MKDLARAPGPGRGAQTKRGHARRELILKVAAGLFAEKGYDGVSINDIGLHAGITGPAIYRYFPGKEDILVSIYQHLYTRAFEGAALIKDSNTAGASALGRLIDLQIELATTEPEKIRIVDREERQLPPEVAKAFRQQRRELFRIWVEVAGKARTDLPAEEIEMTIHAVLALINSITMRRSSERAHPGLVHRLRAMAVGCFFFNPAESPV